MKLYEPSNTKSQSSLLRAARISREMSQRELAEETGMTYVAITHIESGRTTEPHQATKRVLAMTLGYEVSDIFPTKGKQSTSRELRQILARDAKRRKAKR